MSPESSRHCIIFLPGIMGTALVHPELEAEPARCMSQVEVIAEAASRRLRASPIGRWAVQEGVEWALEDFCETANFLWGRVGMLYQSIDNDAWHALLSRTDGISDGGGAEVYDQTTTSVDLEDFLERSPLLRIDVPFVKSSDVKPYDDYAADAFNGKERNVDFRIFGYDWRLSNRHNAELLARYVEAMAAEDVDITLVAHSMGGLIARYYIESHLSGWRYVTKLITIGTPHLGSSEVFTALFGTSQPLPRLGRGAQWVQSAALELGYNLEPGHLLRSSLQRDLAHRFTSLIEMLPVVDFVRQGRRYQPWRETLSGIRLLHHEASALEIVDRFRSGLVAPPRLPAWLAWRAVRYRFVGGIGISTIRDVEPDGGHKPGPVGDGSVPYRSAMGTPDFPWYDSEWLKRFTVIKNADGPYLRNPDELDHQDLLRISSVRHQVESESLKHESRGDRPQLDELMSSINAIHKSMMPFLGRPTVRIAAEIQLDRSLREGPPLEYEIVQERSYALVGRVPGVESRHRAAPYTRRGRLRLAGPVPSSRDSGFALPTKPFGAAILIEEDSRNDCVYVVGWNTVPDSYGVTQNATHAEYQVLSWIRAQTDMWKKAVTAIRFRQSHSPCLLCTPDLIALVESPDDGHFGAIGLQKPLQNCYLSYAAPYKHPQLGTTDKNLSDLRGAGWEIEMKGPSVFPR